MRKFNGYEMTGVTEQDNKVILKHEALKIDMYVDEYNRIFSEAGIYIADVKNIEDGFGLFCT